MRPSFVTPQDIARWNLKISQEDIAPPILEEPVIVEIMYAGLYLVEQLRLLLCPDEYIVRIQYSAGVASFGKDPWEIHQAFLTGFINNTLDFEQDPNNLN
jgi:hypothetical protein